VALILTRQKVPVIDRTRLAPAAALARGAYVLAEAEGGPPQAIVIATGSEVAVALAARDRLAGEGLRVRVVSMPCWEIFETQNRDYQESVLPAAITARVSVEAGVTFGWRRWIGDRGVAIGIDRFGASAPGEINMERFGFTSDGVARAVRALVRA
jgi:transketolase